MCMYVLGHNTKSIFPLDPESKCLIITVWERAWALASDGSKSECFTTAVII